MSVQALGWVLQNSPAKLADRLVLIAIADHASSETGQAWPSVSRLMTYSRLSERSVRASLRNLRDSGQITVEPSGGPHGVNVYTVVMTPAESAPLQDLQGAGFASGGVQSLPPVGAESAPKPLIEPSKEPSLYSSKAEIDLAFEEFWRAYPRKVGKQAARRRFDIAVRKTDAQVIVAGVWRYADSRRGQDPKFTQHPATWLHGGHWDDEAPKSNGHRPVEYPAYELWNQ